MTKTFLRLPEVERVTGLPVSSIYEEMGRGKFPKQIPLGPNRVAWLEDEILEWQKARIAERNDPAVTAAKAKRTARRFRAGVAD
jgi:prophage regulatory protein